MGFKEHGLLLYFDNPLYMAFVKVQADKNLGRSYAGLRLLVQGLFDMGYITKSQYLRYKERYETPLGKEPTQLTLTETPRHEELTRLDKTLAKVIEQWDLHGADERWKETWLKTARENGDLPNAKKLLVYVGQRKEDYG